MLACGALVTILVAQFLLPSPPPPPDPPGLAPRRQTPVTVPPVPEYTAILASPIFAPDRHPGAAWDASDTGGGSLSGYAALGAAVGGPVASAVVSAPGGEVKTLRRGDELEGWRLAVVERTRVVFERNGVRHALIVGAPAEGATAPDGQAQTSPPGAEQ